MRTSQKQDLRVKKTLAAIDSSFRALMLEKNYEHITVTALCERACINKKTFYHYYETLDDLLDEVKSTYVNAWYERTKNLSRTTDVGKLVKELFYFGAEQDELYEVITCNPAWSSLQNSLQNQSNKTLGSKPSTDLSDVQWGFFNTFVTNASLALYRHWVLSGKQVPVSDAAQIAADLITQGVENFISS